MKDLATADQRYKRDRKDVWGFWFDKPKDSEVTYLKSDAVWVEVDRPSFIEESTIRLKGGNPREIQAEVGKKAAEAATGQKVVHVVYDP